MKKRILIIMAFMAALVGCKGTWLMYDTSQTDHIYFQEGTQKHIYSFALLDTDTISVSTTVYLMGVPSSEDRTYKVSSVDVQQGDTISVGAITYPLVSAVEGVDYTLGDLVIPAGATSGTLTVNLLRSAKMLDSCYVRVGIKLDTSDVFLPCATDSTRTTAIMSPYYYVYVNDGEPACPVWWRNASAADPGWDYDLGNFYPEKFRKLLALYHDCEQTAPVFYQYCAEHYGENLDAEPDKKLNNNMLKFWRQNYMTAWAKYVFVPLYQYYYSYYGYDVYEKTGDKSDLHSDYPNFEGMGTNSVNIKNRIGWGDPMDGTYGFFN